jgi:hypothetical protein
MCKYGKRFSVSNHTENRISMFQFHPDKAYELGEWGGGRPPVIHKIAKKHFFAAVHKSNSSEFSDSRRPSFLSKQLSPRHLDSQTQQTH